MTTLYTNDFEAETINGAPANWTVASGTWVVSGTGGTNTSLVHGAKSITETTAAGSLTILMPSASIPSTTSDVDILSTQLVIIGTPYKVFDFALRADATFANGYQIHLLGGGGANATGQVSLIRKVASVNTTIGVALDLPANYWSGGNIATGAKIWVRVQAQGSTFRWKGWKDTFSEPSSWGFINSDPLSSFPTGRFGWITASTAAGAYALDDVTVTDFPTTDGIGIGSNLSLLVPSLYY
jgi:hypothetical protein